MGIVPKTIIDQKPKDDICGFRVEKIDNLARTDIENCLFLICISTLSYDDICDFLQTKGIKYCIHFYTYAYLKKPCVLGNGWIFELGQFCSEFAVSVCDELKHDEMSLAHYLQFLWWKKCNREVVFKKYPVASGEKYWSTCLFSLKDDEVFWDVGAFYGEQTKRFIQIVNGHYSKVICFEPLGEAYDVLRSTFMNYSRIECRNIGLGEIQSSGERFIDTLGMASKFGDGGGEFIRKETIDSFAEDVSLIKIHAEGDELSILKGAVNTIEKSRPVIMVLADHSIDGAFNIPIFFKRFKDYHLYFRMHDYCGNSAVYYFVPNERKII